MNYSKFANKYRYLGYTHLSVGDGWKPLVVELIKIIDREVRPWYIPLWLINIISDMGCGGSIVRIKNVYFYYVLIKLTKNVKIHDIKDKYAELRVYGAFTDVIENHINKTVEKCCGTCESCGSNINVTVCIKNHWYYNYCECCRKNYNCIVVEDNNNNM
jgi:hypothetical protein